MEISIPKAEDWEYFLRWATDEGWRVPSREIDLHRSTFQGNSFVLKDIETPVGFISATLHEKSGWIGNLIVSPDYRRKELGTLLFDHAVDVLKLKGAKTIWLTASSMGRPLYEKKGFEALDGIVRWVCTVPDFEDSQATGSEKGASSEVDALLDGDAATWGESRRGLLQALAQGGTVFSYGETRALLQEGEDFMVMGPWVSKDLCPRENRLLLTSVLAAAGKGKEIVADLLESSPVSQLLAAAGFSSQGRSDLMVLGSAEEVDLGSLVSLASLGSMG